MARQSPAVSRRVDGEVFDRTRERTASLNQLLLGSVVLVLAIMVSAGAFPGDLGLFFTGVFMVFVVTGATLVIPWNRISPAWLALVPAADILAIAFMRVSSPESGLGLLWIFPAMWLPATFGMAGLIGAVLAITMMWTLTIVMLPNQIIEYATFLLPLVIVAVAGTSYLTARRTAAQRTLLDKQARLLSRSLARARRQEQEVTEVLDAVDFGVIRVGADGSTSIANDAHARLQHALRREPGSDDPPAFRADGVTPLPDEELPLERALRGEAFDGQVVWFGEPDGDRRALSVTVRRLRGSDGLDAGAVLVSRDVTAEISARRARDDLVASVSHELRTPLTSILGYLDLAIDDENVPDSARKGLEIAERNAERLLAIVADILAASNSGQSSVELTITPADIDLADVLHASVESLHPRAAERAVTIDDSGIEAARAYADAMRVRQVVDNLITNGIKYNRDGGVVTVGCTTDGDSTWVLVRDSGLGMTEEEMAGLFERFYRARSMRGTGMHGTGLGLAISRDIARAHGGDITVHSSPGVGSTFVVRLPATRAAATPAPRLPAPVAPPELGPPVPAAEQASPTRRKEPPNDPRPGHGPADVGARRQCQRHRLHPRDAHQAR